MCKKEAEERNVTRLFNSLEKNDIADDFKLLSEEIEEARNLDELKEIREEGITDITARLDDFIKRLEE